MKTLRALAALVVLPTFAQHAPQLTLIVIFENDPRMINTYAVIVRDGREPPLAHARAFAFWLSEGNGRQAIDAFKVGPGHVQAFYVWPTGAPPRPAGGVAQVKTGRDGRGFRLLNPTTRPQCGTEAITLERAAPAPSRRFSERTA